MTPRKLVFVVAPRTHFLDLAGPDQVFFEAIYFKAPFTLAYHSLTGQPGTSSGLQFAQLPPYHEAQLEPGDYVLLPGMDLQLVLNPDGGLSNEFLEWLRHQHGRGVRMASICTGAFLLGTAGLLNQRTCTTHWKYTQRLQQRFPQARVVENILYTEEDGIYTSAGIASGIDMALAIVERECGPQMAHKVAREIVVYLRRSGREPQQSVFLTHRNHIHAGIHLVQDWLTEHLDQKATLEELAEKASMSARNFTRTFKEETGVTVGDFVQMLRRERIRELMKQPDLSRAQIAAQVGLSSERQLRRMLNGK